MIELVIVIALVLVNGFFAMSEMAVMTARKSRLKQMAAESRGARKAVALSEHPENFLSTVQIGITMIGVLTGVFGGEAIGLRIGDWLDNQVPALGKYAAPIGIGAAVTLITFISLILGELVPKRLALSRPEAIASRIALPMYGLSRVTAPFVALLATSTRLVLRLLGQGNLAQEKITDEEIRHLVAESHEQGVIDQDERNMLNRVLRLGDRSAASMMTPRTRLVWLDANVDIAENLARMRETPFSRYPVYRGGDGDVLGVLEMKSLAGREIHGNEELFRELRPALFVAESTNALKLLEIFREEQQPLALVVDEYGDILGSVSQNDLLGAVLGRMQATEHGDDEPLVVQRDDGSMLVDGRISTEELRELVSLSSLPGEDDHDFNTLAGLVVAHFGRIPHAGEYFDHQGWRFEVVDLDGARIDKLLLSRRGGDTET
jgi:putative hemolysin